MPKTAVDKDGEAMRTKNKIWLAWEI